MNTTSKFPLKLSGINNPNNQGCTVIAGNIGSVKCELGVYTSEGKNVKLIESKTYQSKDYDSFPEILQDFISSNQLSKPFRISLAVGGPIYKQKCVTLPWMLDLQELKKIFDTDDFYMINDIEGIAYSLADNNPDHLEVIYPGNPENWGNMAIMAPGNGLGECGIYSDQVNLFPFATEGGHSEFSPRNDREVDFFQFLSKIYDIVSWESVLSKEGIFNIFRFYRDVQRQEAPAWLNESIEKGNYIDIINNVDENSDRICKLTLDAYIEFLAREANNLALKLKAIGGFVIAGEIPAKIFPTLNKEKFYKTYIVSDKMQHLLKDTPIYWLKNEKAVMLGAAYYGAFANN